MNHIETQRQRIRRHLKRHGRIDPRTALRWYGSMRLAARIWDLRREGLPIVTVRKRRNGALVAEYRLA